VTHEFLYLPECPTPLLGRDLITKLRVQITFTQGGPTSLMVREPNTLIMAVTMPAEGDWQLYHQEKWDPTKPTCLLEGFPAVWAEKGSPGLACNHVPIMVDLKPGALPVKQRQYPVPQEAHLGIRPTYSGQRMQGY
jgi:hypothetical protein